MRAIVVAALAVASTAAAEPTRLYPEPPQPEPPPQKPPPPAPPPLVDAVPRTFFSVNFGTGGGVIGGETEGLEAPVDTGPQWAPMHLRVELGAFRNSRLAFGITGRVGFPFADTEIPTDKSVMLKVYWMCQPLGLRYHGAVGAGLMRYRVGVDGTVKDTMAAGPVLAGGGAGWVFKLSKSWRVTVDASAILAIATDDKYGGIPTEHSLHFDLDVGLAVFR